MRQAKTAGATLLIMAGILGSSDHQPKGESILSLKIGDTFEEVIRHSSYPVKANSNAPTHEYLQSGETWIKEPSARIRFNDVSHGFLLPPTRFALIGYHHNRVQTTSTSPMNENLPFEKAISLLELIQKQFKAGGWQPYPEGSSWFDLSAHGKKLIYANMFAPGYSRTTTLRIPRKYSMTFRLKCVVGCLTGEAPYLFLIDIGLSTDVYSEPMQKRKNRLTKNDFREFY